MGKVVAGLVPRPNPVMRKSDLVASWHNFVATDLYIFFCLGICLLLYYYYFFLSTVHAQNVCSPVACTRTSVRLSSSAGRIHDPPYICRGKGVTFFCEVSMDLAYSGFLNLTSVGAHPSDIQQLIVKEIQEQEVPFNPT